MFPLLQAMARNKHTTGAGIAYGIALVLTKIGCVWFPGHCPQLTQTAEALKELAVVYGFATAGDATNKQSPPPGSETGAKGKEPISDVL